MTFGFEFELDLDLELDFNLDLDLDLDLYLDLKLFPNLPGGRLRERGRLAGEFLNSTQQCFYKISARSR